MPGLKDKTIIITGSTRGIGLAMALRFARDGANLVITGKTTEDHPKLPGTIYSARDQVKEAGGNAISVALDIRYEEQVESMIKETLTKFGGIDILINNASAISLTPTEATEMKRYDLMQQVNARGTFLLSRLCLPHLKKAASPHILNLSPPLNLNPKWFASHVAYTMAKYGMSMCTLGMAKEYENSSIKINSLWPETGIATSAVKNLLGGDEALKRCRKPEIVAEAAYLILTAGNNCPTGQFYIDSEVLKAHGQEDLSSYALGKESELMRDFFLD